MVGESLARLVSHWRLSPGQIAAYTRGSDTRGAYSSHPSLPYALAPGYADHNTLGFRGSEIEFRKPAGVRRVICLGASTTFGLYLSADGTHCARLGERLDEAQGRWEAVNAGGFRPMDAVQDAAPCEQQRGTPGQRTLLEEAQRAVDESQGFLERPGIESMLT